MSVEWKLRSGGRQWVKLDGASVVLTSRCIDALAFSERKHAEAFVDYLTLTANGSKREADYRGLVAQGVEVQEAS